MHLVVVIPALNEEATIDRVISAIPREIDRIENVSVVLVDDGSSDATGEIAAGAGAVVVRHTQNLGVGAAFGSGLEKALELGADLMVNIDADGQFHPPDIKKLIQPLLDGEAEFVSCTRFALPELEPEMPWIKRRGNAGMVWLVNRITAPKRPFTDVSCGFRGYTRDTMLKLNLFGRFTYTQESFLDLAAKGVPMAEVPLKVRGVREVGQSRVASNLWRYAYRTSSIILRALRDYQPLRFFGTIGAVVLGFGLLQIGFVGAWWLRTGYTSPFRSVVTTGGVTLILGVLLIVLAIMADMLGRMRRIQEQLLYLQKKQYYDSLNPPK